MKKIIFIFQSTFGHNLEDFISHVKFKKNRKYVGGLADLMNKSSNPTKLEGKKKKYLNTSLDNNNINLFSDDYHKNLPPYIKVKKEVDKNIFDRGFAGVKTCYETFDVDILDKTTKKFMNYLKKPE